MLRRIAVLLSVLLGIARADIRSSSELNCDFNQRCRWRNGTGLEDSGEWLVSNIAAIDTQRQIESMHTESNDEFAYTFGMNGRQSAMLISDVISCQLGGAKLKLWYWKTDSTTTLEVCIRQPPGNPDPSKLHCYNALSGTHAQQWIYIAIELPPISQPFELVIRAFFTQPVDIIAIDDISYDAILCGGKQSRVKRTPENLPVIAFKDWQQLRKATQIERLPTMLVVAEPEVSAEETKEEFMPTASTVISASTNPPELTSTTASVTTAPSMEVSPTPLPSAGNQSVDHVNNLMNFLKQAAPLLPVIPVLVRSLHQTDTHASATSRPDPLQGLMQIAGLGSAQSFVSPATAAGTPLFTNKKPYTDTSLSSPIQFNGLSGLINKLGPTASASLGTPLPNYGSPDLVKEVEQQESVEESTLSFITEQPQAEPSTIYPKKVANLYGVQQSRVPKKVDENYVAPVPSTTKSTGTDSSSDEENLDISSLTTSEIRQLEAIHRKIFNLSDSESKRTNASASKRPSVVSNVRLLRPEPPTSTTSHPLTIFRKSGSKILKKNPVLLGQLNDFTNNLTPEMLTDLTMLKDLPNLEELTEGMDLSLLNRPGGFAQLKQQFIERLLRRNMGLPVNSPLARTTLPPPIVPIKISRLKFQTVNSGASEGAGGNYEANYVQPSVHTPDIHSYGHDKSGFIPEYVDPTIPESNLDDSATPLARPASPFEDHSSGIRRQHSRKEPRFKSLCPTVDCNFDDNTFCGYSSTILETDEDLLLGVQPKINAKPWILSQARVSNSLTGIPGDLTGGYFAYAGETNDPKDVFVLTTTDQVRVTEQARLELHIFLAGSYGRFRVCLNGFSDCPLSISGADLTVDARRWNSVSVDLSPGLYTIHLLVDQLRKNYVVGLDQVQLLNRSKSGPISCKTR